MQGTTSRVTLVAPDGFTFTLLPNLPSFSTEGLGAQRVFIDGDTMWLLFSEGPLNVPFNYSAVALDMATFRVKHFIDLYTYERENNPDGAYPFPQQIAVTSRGNGLADTSVYLDPLGDVRLPNLFIADFKIDKSFNFGGMRIIPSMDVFNLTNSNEVLSRRRTQYSYNATSGVGSSSTTLPPNNISSILAPRVIRFGARVTW
jgi:hypothetical protein